MDERRQEAWDRTPHTTHMSYSYCRDEKNKKNEDEKLE